MIEYVVRMVMMAAFGVLGYFGLWLCGVPARPIGYLGAAVVAIAAWHAVHIIGKGLRDG